MRIYIHDSRGEQTPLALHRYIFHVSSGDRDTYKLNKILDNQVMALVYCFHYHLRPLRLQFQSSIHPPTCCLRIRMPAEAIDATSPIPSTLSDQGTSLIRGAFPLNKQLFYASPLNRASQLVAWKAIRSLRSRELRGYSGIFIGEAGSCLMSPVRHFRNSLLYDRFSL